MSDLVYPWKDLCDLVFIMKLLTLPFRLLYQLKKVSWTGFSLLSYDNDLIVVFNHLTFTYSTSTFLSVITLNYSFNLLFYDLFVLDSML